MVHTAPWSHYPNQNVFSDRRNRQYDKSASLRCDGKLFQSPGALAKSCKSSVTEAAVGLCNDTCSVVHGA